MIGLKTFSKAIPATFGIVLPIILPAALITSSIALTTNQAIARQIQVSSKINRLSTFRPWRTIYGKLRFKGGISVASNAEGFGGLSGIVLSKDGSKFIAISDRGWWVKGTLKTDRAQNLSGIKDVSIKRLKIWRKSRQNDNHWLDSEALAPWDSSGTNGNLLVGFERRERILLYKNQSGSFPTTPRQIKTPKAIATGPFNGELESIGRFYAGPKKKWLIAISEENLDSKGNIRGWIWQNKKNGAARAITFSIKRLTDHAITDLAVAPDGRSFFILERSFSLSKLPGFAIRQFKTTNLKPGNTLKGDLLFSGRQPFFAIDNMEGLAVHQTEKAAIQLTIISDDNFNRSLQRTLIYRFELIKPKTDNEN